MPRTKRVVEGHLVDVDFKIDYSTWERRVTAGPSLLFDQIYEQQQIYKTRVSELVSLSTAQEASHKAQISELEEKLALQIAQQKEYKTKITSLEFKLANYGKKQQPSRFQDAECESISLEQANKQKEYWEQEDNKIADFTNPRGHGTVPIETLEGKVSAHEQQQKEYMARMEDLNGSLAIKDQMLNTCRDQIADLESQLAERADVEGIRSRATDTTKTKLMPQTDKPSRTEVLPDPPTLIDGIDPKFANWKYLMLLKLNANDDHFDSQQCRLAYTISRTSGESQDHLVSRLRSEVLAPIANAEDALKYLDMMYRDPELETTDPRDFRPPTDSRVSFWARFREFAWNAVKYKIPPEDWNEKLHDYLQWKTGKNVGDFASFKGNTPKELAKEFYWRMMTQQWEDTDCFDLL
ncbi:hypothetical protein BJX99DRAFT_259041 [Aspergillus californicus]